MTSRANRQTVEDFIVAVINKFDPGFITTPNSAFYDLFVRFYNLTVIANILGVLSEFENRQSFLNTEMSEDDYDNLLGRFFFTRRGGNTTSTVIELVFDNNENVLSIAPSDDFVINGVTYRTPSRVDILRIDYTKKIVDTLTEYSFTIPVVSVTEGSDVVLGLNDIVTIPYTSLKGFKRCFVSSDIVIGQDPETNEAAFARLQESIGTENLINDRSFRKVFNEIYPGVLSHLDIVGYLEPEMYRDLTFTQIPKRVARLVFSGITPLILAKESLFFYYNQNTSIIYRPLNDISLTVFSAWQNHPNGNVSIDIELELVSLYNPLGFHNDVPMRVHKNVGSVNSVIMEDLSLSTPNFVGCVTRSEFYVIPDTQTIETSIIAYGTQGFVSSIEPDRLVELGKFENVLPGDLLFINDLEYLITERYAAGDAVIIDGVLEPVSNVPWQVLRKSPKLSHDTAIHQGGLTDIYVKVPVTRTIKSIRVPVDTQGLITLPEEYMPILKIHDITDSQGNSINYYGWVVGDAKTRFSAVDSSKIYVDPGLIGSFINIEFSYPPFVRTINNYVNLATRRISAANDLVRYFNPLFITILAQVKVQSTSDNVDAALRNGIEAYLSSVRHSSSLPVSKIIEAMHNSVAELERVAKINIFVQQYMPNGDVFTLNSEDLLTPVTDLSQGVSPRTCVFLLDTVEFIYI